LNLLIYFIRPSVKDLPNHEFLADETGLKVEVVSRDEAVARWSDKEDFQLRVLEEKKRRDKLLKESEVIQFELKVVADDSDKHAQILVYFSKYF